MKLFQTLASATGFRMPECNPARLAALDRLLLIAKSQSADVVLLPGGFLCASNPREFVRLREQLTRQAEANAVGLLVGIDRVAADGKKSGKSSSAAAKTGADSQLPYFGLAVGPFGHESLATPIWQQTSSTRDNAWNVDDGDVPGQNRVVTHSSQQIGVLICGELFSPRARESIASLDLDLVVDLGHSGMGTGVTRAMENIARNGGCAVAHTHHVADHGNQSLHFVDADGVRRSVPRERCSRVEREDFWIAWCMRDI